MEAHGIAASIAGLVSLGIQLVDKLQAVVAENSEPADQQQLYATLASSELFLRNIQALVARARKIHPSSSCGLAMFSLKVQLEDYTEEINAWLEIGHRLAKAPTSRLKLWFTRFSKYKVGTKPMRERLASHEERMNLSLNIVGRELDIDNNLVLIDINCKVHDAVQVVTDEAAKINRRLEELSSSSDSLLSHSRSSTGKLDDISTDLNSSRGDFRELKTVLLDFVSSASSQSSHDDKGRENHSKQRPPHAQSRYPLRTEKNEPAMGSSKGAGMNADDSDRSSANSDPERDMESDPQIEGELVYRTWLTRLVERLSRPYLSKSFASSSHVPIALLPASHRELTGDDFLSSAESMANTVWQLSAWLPNCPLVLKCAIQDI